MNFAADIEKTGLKLLFGKRLKSNRENSEAVNENTIKTGGLGHL